VATFGTVQSLALAHDAALLGHIQPGQHAQQTGFARAVKADQANARFVQLQVQPGKHRGLPPA